MDSQLTLNDDIQMTGRDGKNWAFAYALRWLEEVSFGIL
jgi:hypothetical protein